MASVSLVGLGKTFDSGVVAVRDVTLEVADGEFVAVLGPSGSGKSTILRCVAGLEAPTSGQVLIGRRDVTALAPADRNVAMVFQNYALYPHLTVRENLEFPLRMRRARRAEWPAVIQRVAEQLEITGLLGRLPAQLSGGQRQRVALGRALVRDPAAFLFDEPLSNLDAALRSQLRTELMELHAAMRATMLYVTHDQVEALTMGQRIVVMRDGLVEQAGPAQEVYLRPVTLFAAGFVGRMNLVPRRSEGAAGSFSGDGIETVMPDGAGMAATMGIRPEDMTLVPPGQGEADGVVTLVERLGSETLVHLRVGEAALMVARVPGFAGAAIGDRAGLRLVPERRHWFDAEGRRL
jgi:ABC-type sugar transport system ATPase subunit